MRQRFHWILVLAVAAAAATLAGAQPATASIATESTVSANPTSVSANGDSATTITVTVISDGSPVPGHTVTVSGGNAQVGSATEGSDTTDANGVATFTARDSTAETVTFTATDQTGAAPTQIDQTAQVRFYGPPDPTKSTVVADPTSVPADGESQSTITVTLKDANGAPVPSQSVSLSQDGNATVPDGSVFTDANGQSAFVVSDANPETVTFTGSFGDGEHVAQTATVDFTSTSVDSGVSTVVADDSTLPADDSTSTTITVTLRNSNGDPVPNKEVSLSDGGAGSTFSGEGTTDANGQMTFDVSSAHTGEVTYTARDVPDELTIDEQATIDYVAPTDAGNSTATPSTQSVPANGDSTATISVQLEDGNGQPIPNRELNVTASSSTTSIGTGTTITTSSNGNASLNVSDATAETVTFTITDPLTSTQLNSQPTVDFTSGTTTTTTTTTSGGGGGGGGTPATTTTTTTTTPPPTTTTTTTTTPPPPPPPVSGQNIDVLPFSGTVLVNGQPLLAGEQIPVGSTIDATQGTITLETRAPDGSVQSASFTGGVFKITQAPGGTPVLTLVGGDFSVCNNAKAKRHIAAKPSAAKTNHTVVRSLWGSGHGNFQTKGRYAAATVRGTVWHTSDRCDGTNVTVARGTVTVQDLVKHITVTVTAPHSYLANAP